MARKTKSSRKFNKLIAQQKRLIDLAMGIARGKGKITGRKLLTKSRKKVKTKRALRTNSKRKLSFKTISKRVRGRTNKRLIMLVTPLPTGEQFISFRLGKKRFNNLSEVKRSLDQGSI